MRRPILAANWKMNKTASEASAFVADLLSRIAGEESIHITVELVGVFDRKPE